MATILRTPCFTRIERRFNPTPLLSQSSVWTNPLVSVLKSQDKFFSAAGLGPTYAYPNPIGKAYPSDLRTFLNPIEIQLNGKDQFFAAAGMGPNYDWPNPLRPRYAIDLKTHSSFDLPLLSSIAPPFKQLEWPNPKGAIYPIDLRTFLNPIEIQLNGKDKFFYAAGQGPTYAYPNPRGYSYPLENRTQASFPLTLSSMLPPFYQLNWPNPRGAIYASDLRTFLDPLKLNLLNKDKFFGGAGQTPANLDWPLPRGYSYPSSLRTHLGAWSTFYSVNPVTPTFAGDKRQFMGEIQQMGLGSILNSSMGIE